jgi:hypothetical protein
MVEPVPQSGRRIRQQQQELSCRLLLKTKEYAEMVKLAKELGMTNMRQYVKYCMVAILESHKGEIKQESFQEAY